MQFLVHWHLISSSSSDIKFEEFFSKMTIDGKKAMKNLTTLKTKVNKLNSHIFYTFVLKLNIPMVLSSVISFSFNTIFISSAWFMLQSFLCFFLIIYIQYFYSLFNLHMYFLNVFYNVTYLKDLFVFLVLFRFFSKLFHQQNNEFE